VNRLSYEEFPFKIFKKSNHTKAQRKKKCSHAKPLSSLRKRNIPKTKPLCVLARKKEVLTQSLANRAKLSFGVAEPQNAEEIKKQPESNNQKPLAMNHIL
jgi:hypothetical protein